MAREYFCAYHSLRKSVTALTDAECGRLFMACLEYSELGTTPELRGNERFIFPMIAEQIDRDKAAYEARCRKNAANISKRWEKNTNEYERIQANTNPYQKYQEKEEDKEKEKDKEERSICACASEAAAPAARYLEENLMSLSSGNWEDLRQLYEDGITDELVKYAVDEACAQGKRTWGYVRSILNKCVCEGITTLQQVRDREKRRQAEVAQRSKAQEPRSQPTLKPIG